MITPTHYMLLSAALFMIGVIGVMVRRNIIIIFMSIELILNAVNINLVAFSAQLHNQIGQVFAIFVIAVAAAEAAVGLGIILSFYRNKETVNIDEMNLMRQKRLRPHRAADKQIRRAVSASVRAGGGAPAPVQKRWRLGRVGRHYAVDIRMKYIWLIPLLPGIGALINGLVGIRFFSRRLAGLLACATMTAALGLALVAFFELLG